jgi:hypothetical protein
VDATPEIVRGPIEPDDPEASTWTFTSDRWLGDQGPIPGSYLWRRGDRVTVCSIYAKDEGKGYFRDLVDGIEKAGFRVAVPTPLAHMEAILKHYGFVPHREVMDGDSVEVWERPKENNMIKAQEHSKFKVFIPEDNLSNPQAMRLLANMVEGFTKDGKIAAKSLGIEYLEGEKRLVLSLGYRDDEPGYQAKITSVSLGKLNLRPEEIEAAMSKAAEGVENVICHEFYVTGDGEFVMVLLSHA